MIFCSISRVRKIWRMRVASHCKSSWRQIESIPASHRISDEERRSRWRRSAVHAKESGRDWFELLWLTVLALIV